MEGSAFCIPTESRFWTSAARDRPATREESKWAEIEAQRALAIVAKLFPQTTFMLVKAPPPSQRYIAGTTNAEIRRVLEERTTLRLIIPRG